MDGNRHVPSFSPNEANMANLYDPRLCAFPAGVPRRTHGGRCAMPVNGQGDREHAGIMQVTPRPGTI